MHGVCRSFGGCAFVIAIAAGGCEGNVIPPSRSGSQLDTVVIHPDTVPADDVSTVAISALVPDTSGVAPSQVIFSSTAGIFVANDSSAITVATDTSGTAHTLLRAPRDSVSALLTAAAGTSLKYYTVLFRPAEPDHIYLDPDSFTVTQGAANVVTITAYLRRTVGLVSLGTNVQFSASSGGVMIGTFGAPSVSDDSGIVRVRYTPGTGTDSVTGTITGPIPDTITAKVIGTNPDTVFATGHVVITVTP